MSAPPSLSIVIPALDEAPVIGRTVAVARAVLPQAEIVVVDGGSRDGTVDLVRAAGVKVIASRRGRGEQCHAGAAAASGEILVFLHADTRLPPEAGIVLSDAFADPQVQIGLFRLRFDRNHWLLRFYAFFSRWDTPLTRFGDQCICVRRSFYHELGGFPCRPLLEDVHLLRLARRRTRIHRFAATVTTSARRFERDGMIRTQLRNGRLLWQYWRDTSKGLS